MAVKKATVATTMAKVEATKAAEVKKTTDTKVAEAKVVEAKKVAVEKAEPVKKAPAKKAAAPKEEKKAEPAKKAPAKKAPAKKATAKISENVVVEYAGGQISTADIVSKAKEISGKKTIKELNVYYQPETSKVYFTADGEEGSFEL